MLQQWTLPNPIVAKPPMPVAYGIGALLKAVRSTPGVLQLSAEIALSTGVKIMTLPYYRLYYFNTTAPLERIALLASESPRDTAKVLRAISSWRARKLTELQFITISCTVLAAAVIGSFSWTTIEEAYWLTHGFWHSSLIFAILGILLSASEVTVLHLLGPLRHTGRESRDYATVNKYYPLLLSSKNRPGEFIPRVKMIFTWQAPLMFMSYSVCGFLVGLTVLVCTPLIREGHNWTIGHNIAIMYLTVFAGAGTTFVFCSFWVYHYVELDLDADGTGDSESIENETVLGYGITLTPFAEEVGGSPSTLKMDNRPTAPA